MSRGILYKWLNEDGTPCHGGTGKWPLPKNGKPGEWLSLEGELVPCENGLHLCRPKHLIYWIGPVLHTAEDKPGTECIECDLNIVVRTARLLVRVESWNERTACLFVCDCAERAWERKRIGNPSPRTVRRIGVARDYARGATTPEELCAAKTAAWAAWTANDSVVWADWIASKSAAWVADRVARDAVRDAARAASSPVAERAWQTQRLLWYLNGQPGGA